MSLAASCVAVRTARAASALQPPVITEHFTRLPCHQNTTIGLEGCAEGQLLRADKRLNEQVALVFDLFPTTKQRRQFVKAETSWFSYRGADCQSFSDVVSGGSLAPVDYAECATRDDQARSSDLHSFFKELAQGRLNAPTWP